MKFYLSSYGLGDDPSKLAQPFPAQNRSVGYISNARDYSSYDPDRNRRRTGEDLRSLEDLGLKAETIDLRDYFGKTERLREKLATLGGVWISGGNVFVLRQAMKLSGFDMLLTQELSKREDFIYGGYSAAGCVLAPDLHAYAIVDDATDFPYPEQQEQIWEGLGLIDFAFMPHYKSDHPESAAVDEEIAYCKAHGIAYKAIRDGEVLILE